MYRRPNLYTSYESESQMLPTFTKKVLAAITVAIMFLMPFSLPIINPIPFVRFLGDGDWLRPMSTVFIFAIAALGLNILTGIAGQVSLGHAFFMGVGAYTGAVLGGASGGGVWGWELPIWIWLPGAGVGAALVGILVSPVAVRLRGLYLAIVTLGLVFVGIHLGNTSWGRKLAGDPGLGRDFPTFDIRLWKEDTPLVDVSNDGHWLWFDVSDTQKKYLFLAALMLVFILIAKNIARTRTGRALQAIRDRDIAAEVMGVPEFKYKLIAFAASSFLAGVAGVLFASLAGKLPASSLEPHAVGRVHRDPAHRRCRHRVGRPARHVLRRARTRASSSRSPNGCRTRPNRAAHSVPSPMRSSPKGRGTSGRCRSRRRLRATRSTSSTGTS